MTDLASDKLRDCGALLGSCAEGIIRHSACPVLTVVPRVKHPSTGSLPFNTIVFATDFARDAAGKVSVALAFARDSCAKLYLCHVSSAPGRDISETLRLQLAFETALEKLIPQSTYDWCVPEAW